MDERWEIVQHRLRRAHEALEDAHIMADAERWNPRPWIKGAEQFVGTITALIDEPGS